MQMTIVKETSRHEGVKKYCYNTGNNNYSMFTSGYTDKASDTLQTNVIIIYLALILINHTVNFLFLS